ncbi:MULTISPECIES: SfnB family sulfur acquisition oxidoreductase [unclassified Pseudomonas]|jgi:SfnB family sulfur acquisition oxidoreductase|uniref:SfnB family sulfur acquisition oxidoreductase n=1 Tax=unclassified Pseudomonas TaxID=196821 RepID=UPI000272C572|nr:MULTISPECIES: SfnB family sulfur acquisition oxidoreductase [unclassified Pseudomonas]MDP9063019.1 SfnB family sulfur acquisition oxidoreductase [Pseudomonadota bacterium]AUO20660.1 SfnB family sulfur acquisition oxidoreductase [Pseudomonas sp. NC02]EJF70542.1 putative dehydrogenase [Pseudomonas sp. Ag1]MBT1269521.1 SfnB family sulfur acquisition oxidoreductase [Pseudomonas sp. VS38]MDE1911193.1 SfnB family sulfur acquisition oxidoreductase [Pseudomonas sp.]|eukprot:gene6464-9898_t
MSNLAQTPPQSDLDVAPLLLPAKVLRNDAEALSAAHELAQAARLQAARRDQQRKLPWAEIEHFTRSGLGSISIPREYGGPQVSFVTLAEVFAIISAADPALGQIPQNHFGILHVLQGAASERQKKQLFQSVLDGWRIGNGGPERGTKNTLDLKSRITAEGDGYVVSGQKFYSTGALFAHWVAVKALNDDGKVVMAFVRRGTEGLRIVDDWSGFGQRTTASGTVLLDQVAVDAELVVETWRLGETPGIQGAVSQLIQAAIDAGIARGAIDDTISFVRERSRPWIDAKVERASDDLYVIADIGKLKIELHAAEALLRKAGQVLDQVSAAPITAQSAARASIAVAEAKVLTTEISLLASEKLFELAGSRATLAEFNLDRHWRNARVHTLHDPVRWKYHAVGAYHLNGTLPARHSWI